MSQTSYVFLIEALGRSMVKKHSNHKTWIIFFEPWMVMQEFQSFTGYAWCYTELLRDCFKEERHVLQIKQVRNEVKGKHDILYIREQVRRFDTVEHKENGREAGNWWAQGKNGENSTQQLTPMLPTALVQASDSVQGRKHLRVPQFSKASLGQPVVMVRISAFFPLVQVWTWMSYARGIAGHPRETNKFCILQAQIRC